MCQQPPLFLIVSFLASKTSLNKIARSNEKVNEIVKYLSKLMLKICESL